MAALKDCVVVRVIVSGFAEIRCLQAIIIIITII
jgi:hypothetical protein